MHSPNYIYRIFLATIAILSTLLTLTSCKKETVGGETEYFAVLDGINVLYKDGMFTFDNGLLSYLSFETEKIVPVCYKPNCAHDSESDCPAMIPSTSTIFVYGDTLYTFESEYGWDKKSGEATITTTLFVSSVSGTDKHRVAVIDDCSVHGGAYVKDGIAYFTASEIEFDETGSNTGCTTEYLCCCDLADGSIEKLAKMSEGYHAYLSINGCYKERLVLEYSDSSNSAEDYRCRKYSYYCPESGDFEVIDSEVIRAQKDYLILKNGDTLVIYSADSDEPYVITDKRYVDPEWGGYVISDGKLILSADGIAMELETRKEYKTLACTIMARYNGQFVVRIPKHGYRFAADNEFYLE